MKSKNFNGLIYNSFGEGPTVVFIHGFLESSSMWEYLPLEKLKINCILVDLPGHGKSELNDLGTPSMEFYAGKLDELVVHLGIQQFSIVGHSMGGYVGLAWLQLNKSIQKLTFLNSHFWEDSEEKKKDRISVSKVILQSKSLFLKTAIPNLFLRPEDHQGAIKAIIEEAETFDSKGIAYAALAMGRRANFTGYVNKNPQKFSMILGKEDAIVPLALINESLTSTLQIDVIEDCGHMAHIEKSDLVYELLKKHLLST
jgi:pimeloyl-ACP methyl ester carboxylesterase